MLTHAKQPPPCLKYPFDSALSRNILYNYRYGFCHLDLKFAVLKSTITTRPTCEDLDAHAVDDAEGHAAAVVGPGMRGIGVVHSELGHLVSRSDRQPLHDLQLGRAALRVDLLAVVEPLDVVGRPPPPGGRHTLQLDRLAQQHRLRPRHRHWKEGRKGFI